MIIKATSDHGRELEAFEKEHWPYEYVNTEQQWAYKIEDGIVYLFLGKDAKIIGFLHARTSKEQKQLELERLLVHPDHREEGIGTALMETVIEGRASQCRWAFLEVAQDDPKTISLYENLGFHKNDEDPVETIDGKVYITMEMFFD